MTWVSPGEQAAESRGTHSPTTSQPQPLQMAVCEPGRPQAQVHDRLWMALSVHASGRGVQVDQPPQSQLPEHVRDCVPQEPAAVVQSPCWTWPALHSGHEPVVLVDQPQPLALQVETWVMLAPQRPPPQGIGVVVCSPGMHESARATQADQPPQSQVPVQVRVCTPQRPSGVVQSAVSCWPCEQAGHEPSYVTDTPQPAPLQVATWS